MSNLPPNPIPSPIPNRSPERTPALVHGVETRLVRAACRLPGVVGRAAGPALQLTFDDGPGPGTGSVLSTLAARGIRATFFVLGDAARAHPVALRDILAAGHVVGAHGMAHIDAWRHPRRAVTDMAGGCALLEDLLGDRVALVRPPYGRISPGVWRWARRTDRQLVLWDVDTRDYVATPPPVEHVAPLLRPGSILLLHDNATVWAGPDAFASAGRPNPNTLGDYLDFILAEGWTFEGDAS